MLKKLAGFSRVWSYGDGYVVRNVLSYFRLYSPEGYEALFPYRYGELLNTIPAKGAVTDQIQRTDATLSETGQYELMGSNPYRLRLMSLLGIKYVLERISQAADTNVPAQRRFPANLFVLAWQGNGWRIWEYRGALPRAFFTTSVIVENDPSNVIKKMFDAHTDIGTTVILEKPPLSPATQRSVTQAATITKYTPQDVEISVAPSVPGFLFLSDTYYPGWHAYVDGTPTTIYRADYAFRAVPVSVGNHRVRFVYEPGSVRVGVASSVVGIAVAFPLLFFLRKKRSGE